VLLSVECNVLPSCCVVVCSGCLSCFALGCFWFVGWTWLLEILLCILWESRVAASFARSLFKSASSVEKGFPLHGEKCHRVPSCHPCSFLSLLTPGQVKEGLQFPIRLFFDSLRCLSSFIIYLLQCPFVARTEGRPFKKAIVKVVFPCNVFACSFEAGSPQLKPGPVVGGNI